MYTKNHNLRINQVRLSRYMTDIAKFGETPNGGVTRLTLSNEDRDARLQLQAWFEALGCETKIDAIGNMFFIYPGEDRSLPAVMAGSHCDSQPQGGRFDGILGIIAGLEICHALNEAGVKPLRDIVIVNWTNEEGSRFSPGCTGSGVYAGILDIEQMYTLKDRNDVILKDELVRIGFLGNFDSKSIPIHAAFELHIEQGPVLENSHISIGIPKGIVGVRWFDVTIKGVANHAGPTPMNNRKDALYTFSRLNQAVFEMALQTQDVVATVGEVNVTPNSRNVIPGYVHFTIDVRSWNEPVMDQFCSEIASVFQKIAAETKCTVQLKNTWKVARAPFCPELVSKVKEASQLMDLKTLDLVSGAFHDSINIGKIIPSAMIFVPSIDGRSHAEEENTSWEDCAAGINILLQSVLTTANDPENITYELPR